MKYKKIFSLSILLWMRKDKPREESMNYWKGPHSKIISASPELLEYRQHHLSEIEYGFWPKEKGLNTDIIIDRKIDGVAEVSYQRITSPLLGNKQTKLAFKDEINLFRRTLMHIGLPWSSKWWYTKSNSETEIRDFIFIQRNAKISKGKFKKYINTKMAEMILESDGITELRSQVYLPWNKLTWNTPNVAHDNPKEHQINASYIIGFENNIAREKFYKEIAPKINKELVDYASSIYAYKEDQTITFVDEINNKK